MWRKEQTIWLIYTKRAALFRTNLFIPRACVIKLSKGLLYTPRPLKLPPPPLLMPRVVLRALERNLCRANVKRFLTPFFLSLLYNILIFTYMYIYAASTHRLFFTLRWGQRVYTLTPKSILYTRALLYAYIPYIRIYVLQCSALLSHSALAASFERVLQPFLLLFNLQQHFY